MKDEHAADLVNVARSGKCDAYPVLMACPDAAKVNAEWDTLWETWAKCSP